MIRLVCLFVLWAASACADSFPALYDVTGVASNDTLNVRADASASAPVIGTLAHNQTGVEVIATNAAQTWGLVNVNGEQSGWTSLRYLARQQGQSAGDFPAVTSCYGTEPFWDLNFTANAVVFSQLGVTGFTNPIQRLRSLNRTDRFSVTSELLTATLRREVCSDGMSDRGFGISIEVLTNSASGPTQYTGCCTISQN